MSRGFGPDDLLACYARGVFPMADGRDDPRLFLVDPVERGVLPLAAFHVPKRLARTVRRAPFEVRIDTAFAEVVEACAAATPDRPETWINAPIMSLYSALHRRGAAHSVECWDGDTLVGGLYGVRIGGAFFGESMMSRATDASKIALTHLAACLIAGGFTLLDSQFITAHLSQFGAVEVPRATYRSQLNAALTVNAAFPPRGPLTLAWLAQRNPSLAEFQEGLGPACLKLIAEAAELHHRPRTG